MRGNVAAALALHHPVASAGGRPLGEVHTASAVEAACWMSGMSKDYPEHLEAGLSPHSVTEKYYFARGPQYVNRVVEITDLMDQKISINLLNTAQGPAGQRGAQLRRRLTEQG
jgi:hypothetical protein